VARQINPHIVGSSLREIEEKLQQLPAFDKLTPVLALVLSSLLSRWLE